MQSIASEQRGCRESLALTSADGHPLLLFSVAEQPPRSRHEVVVTGLPGAFLSVLNGRVNEIDMTSPYDLRSLAADELLTRLDNLLARDRQLGALLLSHIAEVDARKLFLDQACSSMFVYCVARLHMSEPTAYKRIEAARAARRFPVIFERFAAGDVGLTVLILLAPRLTEENHLQLLTAATRLSKREVERLLATRFPRPDLPTSLRKVPDPPSPQPETSPAAPQAPPSPTEPAKAPAPAPASAFALAPPPRPEVKPLSADRYYLKVTLSANVHDKLLEAQALLRHRIPQWRSRPGLRTSPRCSPS